MEHKITSVFKIDIFIYRRQNVHHWRRLDAVLLAAVSFFKLATDLYFFSVIFITFFGVYVHFYTMAIRRQFCPRLAVAVCTRCPSIVCPLSPLLSGFNWSLNS